MARLPRAPKRPILSPDEARGEVAWLPPGLEISRIYFAGGTHPGGWNRFRDWGPTKARLDHHVLPAGSATDRRILYAGDTLTTCAAEVFQHTGVIDAVAGEPYFAGLRVVRPVRLLSFRSDWPTRAGASQALASGTRAWVRQWSRAVWEDLVDIEGIVFDSSMHHGGTNFALYERAEDAFDASPVFNEELSHRGLRNPLRHVAADLNYGLVLPSVVVTRAWPLATVRPTFARRVRRRRKP